MSNISNIKKLLWAGLCVVAVACTKTSTAPEPNSSSTPDKPAQSVHLYPVRFSVGNIEISNARMAAKEMSARDYLHFIFYAAYDSTGRLASKIIQDSTSRSHIGPEFGQLNDSLAAGTYTVVVAGAVGRPYEGDSDTTLASLYFNTNSDDVFYKKFTLTVGDKDSTSANVKLSRITGQLQLNLTDTLPAQVKEIKIVIDNFPLNYHPVNDAVDQLSNNLFGYLNTPNAPLTYPAGMGFWGSDLSHTVTITALDYSGIVIQEKVVKNVYVYPNKKTVLKGSINPTASDGGTSDINIVIDPDYADTIIQTF